MQTWRDGAMQESSLISERTWAWCVEELRDKAKEIRESGLVMVLNAGAGVCKSDTVIPASLRNEIKDFVASAAVTISPYRDGHTWNLIDPSLYMLTRDHTRVLSSGGSVPLEQTLEFYGQGDIAPFFEEKRRGWEIEWTPYSRRYQWLPCEVEFCGQEGSTGVHITSYINDLHPQEEKSFYHTLQHITSKAIEPWNKTMIRIPLPGMKNRLFRFEYSEPGTTYSYEDWKHGRTAQAIVPREDYEHRDRSPDSLWWDSDKFRDPMIHYDLVRARKVWDHEFQIIKLQDEFREKGLQVIVKLGGVELTPDTQLSFPGEDWHKDGMLNEQIVGVTTYAFSIENITTPRISFSQKIWMHPNEFHFDQGDDVAWDVPFLEQLFGIKNDGPSRQDIGSVPLREGRLLTFSNCLRHRLEPFELVDRARPGHCRFLTLWLVNPYFRICSTRNVPLQRQDWWEQKTRSHLASAYSVPQELSDLIIADAVGSKEQGSSWLMGRTEADHHRGERVKDEALAHMCDKKQEKSGAICLWKQY
ncbi:DUF4246 domain-containing protein [Aspergillus stella-maris]|uniref:DUF4246 domain-containing protein n=1 Tax=Aspergillus stella-maris TaxID=1810926 RepID=UPI003CCCA2AB